jgi:hypothetical protein
MPTQATTATRTKVQSLTRFNIIELAKLDGWTTAGTYAIFAGPVNKASQSVEAALRDAMTAHGGRSTQYRSLIAVKNKLRGHLVDGGHRHVMELGGDRSGGIIGKTPVKQGKSAPAKVADGTKKSKAAPIRNARVADPLWSVTQAAVEKDPNTTMTSLWVDACIDYCKRNGIPIPTGTPSVVGEQPLFGDDK